MGRKPGPDKDKIKKIKSVLAKYPNGLWVREIARKASLTKSTVSLYLEKHMKDDVEDVFTSGNGWIKIVRLKK
jgi:DNA invertase Pin-like site-specific DNA recombinase